MDKKVLQQIVDLLKTKCQGEVFDLSNITVGTCNIDDEFNRLIMSKQICGVKTLMPSKPQKYQIDIRQNVAYVLLDDVDEVILQKLKIEAESMKDKRGYSKELSEFSQRISSELNRIIIDRCETMDIIQSVILSVIDNTELLSLELFTGHSLVVYKLSGQNLIDEIVNINMDCMRRLFCVV